jgi:hypothetical protein
MSELGSTEGQRSGDDDRLAPQSKLKQVVESRKAWAGVIGMVTTLALWWMGEIDGARATEAMTWVLGIFIGSVALEDGMARLFGSLASTARRSSTKGRAGTGDD